MKPFNQDQRFLVLLLLVRFDILIINKYMDCIKFFQTITIFAIPFFVSLYCIVEFQPDYYKYPKEDISELKTAIIVAGIVIYIYIYRFML